MENEITNVNLENNKKGFPKILIIFLVLILIGISGFGGWKLGTMYSNHENTKNETNDKVEDTNNKNNDEKNLEKDLPTKNENYSFYSEVKDEVLVNEEKFEVLSYYYIDEKVLNFKEGIEEVKDTRYVLRRGVYVGNSKILDATIVDVFDEKTSAIDYIKMLKLSEDNYKYFKDSKSSKNYLVLYLGNNNNIINDDELITNYSPYFVKAYILDSTGKIYKEIFYDDDMYDLIGIFVDKNDIGERNSVLASERVEAGDFEFFADYFIYFDSLIDYHDSFIYYVVGDCLGYKEYKLSISDGELNEEFIKDYSEEQIYGAGGC